MRYAYYPGCSLTESAVEYDVSTRRMLEALDVELVEVPDWTCCGASAVEAVSRLLTYTLSARNIALADRDLDAEDMLIPCSACYLNHRRVQHDLARQPALAADVAEVLADEGLTYVGRSRIRHLLDVLAVDFTAKDIEARAVQPFDGLKVAMYYGCQALRPYGGFDDAEHPTCMDPLLAAIGAESLDWAMGGKCCGASLMATKKEVALHSVAAILSAAQGADVIATACPMCQMNLEAYQSQALGVAGGGEPVSVLYLPQLVGLAFGLTEKDVLLGKNMMVTDRFLRRVREREATAAA